YPENWIEPESRLSTRLRVALGKVAGFICKECLTKPSRKASRGTAVLFVGKSRARALIAAQALARDLALDLYRIDLSAVASKYIGETEKNLRRIFDAAEKSSAILFFDEADALFGKRSDVKDSHDRYANIEINYLLQRVEQRGGLSVLTTNRRSNIDDAVLRRLRFIISLQPPVRKKRPA
ncbi:MAG: ATP-binding protein, partial [Chthoniobacterales bacterium]